MRCFMVREPFYESFAVQPVFPVGALKHEPRSQRDTDSTGFSAAAVAAAAY